MNQTKYRERVWIFERERERDLKRKITKIALTLMSGREKVTRIANLFQSHLDRYRSNRGDLGTDEELTPAAFQHPPTQLAKIDDDPIDTGREAAERGL